MAEDLVDGEFWLPSEILNDVDMAMDFHFATSLNGSGGGSSVSLSDITSSETGSFDDDDDDDILALAHPHSSCPFHSKVVLSSSPQSTLYGCVCNQSSSRESVSPPQPQPLSEATATNTATFDLLNKAAGEVARLKIEIENNKNNKKVVGTGFFDCTQKGVSYRPPLLFQQPFLHYPHPPMVQLPHPQPPSQNRATKTVTKSTNTRPLGLPPSAWPPLQAQPQQAKPKAQLNSVGPISVEPIKGTGVFLPRCVPTVTTANQLRKKDGNFTKPKTGKGSQSQSNHRKNSGKPSAVKTSTMTTNNNDLDILLPQEWTY